MGLDDRTAGPEWAREARSLTRDWEFDDFSAALAFVNRVGAVAEAHGHHPDILLHDYRRVRLTLSTHSSGRVTDADERLAAEIDGL